MYVADAETLQLRTLMGIASTVRFIRTIFCEPAQMLKRINYRIVCYKIFAIAPYRHMCAVNWSYYCHKNSFVGLYFFKNALQSEELYKRVVSLNVLILIHRNI